MYDGIKAGIETDIVEIEIKSKAVLGSERKEVAKLINYQNRVRGKIDAYSQLTGNKEEVEGYLKRLKETEKNIQDQLGLGFFFRLDQFTLE